MARIRTIKPEFFTSESVLSVSPLARLFFIGLWCEADREGRLKWKPKTLKFRYLPADSVDISELAYELTSNNMIILYSVDDVEYCEVTGFTTHQVVNNRERGSEIPPFSGDASTTRKTRVKAEGKERKGKERKGMEGNETDMPTKAGDDQLIEHSDQTVEPKAKSNDALDIYQYWVEVMRMDPGRTKPTPKRMKAVNARLKQGYSVFDIQTAIYNCSQDPWSMGQNDRHKPYNDLELICRTGEKLESYFNDVKTQEFGTRTQQTISNLKDWELGNERQ